MLDRIQGVFQDTGWDPGKAEDPWEAPDRRNNSKCSLNFTTFTFCPVTSKTALQHSSNSAFQLAEQHSRQIIFFHLKE